MPDSVFLRHFLRFSTQRLQYDCIVIRVSLHLAFEMLNQLTSCISDYKAATEALRLCGKKELMQEV